MSRAAKAAAAVIERWPHSVPAWSHYALSLGAVVMALLIRWLLDPLLDIHSPFVTVYTVLLPLVLLVRPGAFVAGAALGLGGAWYLFAPPRLSLHIPNEEMAAQVVLLIMAVLIATVPAWLSSQAQRRQRLDHERLRESEEARARYAETLEHALAQRTLELTEAHENLRRTEAMAVLGTLSSGIAHDLGNLLMPLHARLQALRTLDASPEVREHLDALARNIQYIADLARRLKHSIAPSPATESPAETFDPARWRAESEQFLRSIVPDDLDLQCHVPRGLPMLAINKVGLTQAVYNLVQNAVKAMHRSTIGSRIIVRAARADHHSDGGVEISVEDDGPGMSPETLARCMMPRFTTEAQHGSLGLGLALVKAFVDSSGGAIEAHSPPPGKPRGTLIVMRFHAADPIHAIHGEPWPAHAE